MKTFQTRWLLMKKNLIGLLFWLIFPFLFTWGIIALTDSVKEEAKIPIGIIQQDKSEMADQLVDRLSESNQLHIYEMKENEALLALTRHELDSFFIIHDGYEKNVRSNEREDLITGYASNLSFAYVPVKEIVVSNVQRDTLRMKAASYIQLLETEYNSDFITDKKTIIADINQTEETEQLLSSRLILDNTDFKVDKGEPMIFDPWNIWALIAFLATFFIFDWVIKEREASVRVRLYFTKDRWKTYLMKHFGLITFGLFMFDILTYFGIEVLLQSGNISLDFSFLAILFMYRITMNLTAFLIANTIRSLPFYYSFAAGFILLITITSTAILPIEYLIKKFSWIGYFNPVQPFIHETFHSYWLFLMIGILGIWLIRRDYYNA